MVADLNEGVISMPAKIHRCTSLCRSILFCVATTLVTLSPLSFAAAQNFVDIKPSPAQVQWQDLEIGVIFHFGTNTFLNREWGDGTADPSVFRPNHVDTDQWMEAAKAAGARYAVLVAKHHDGFALWPSKQTEYSVRNSPWLDGKGDLVRMALGLGVGIWIAVQLFIMPKDAQGYRTWLYLGIVGVPFALICAVALWWHHLKV